ncbi:hypothetical protein LS73_007450 [Helicobacter muridarum]|uniref:MORN repeat variant n=1 Tax=Helicobacter muridarum TaxID=216 RepID=A0A099TUK8_9HELI|nr:hypothetical protein [Helicobacter muridarum]TLD99419.1 hypothetical protein LS73_007450 [Helicobacter muridarum]STQ85500.1 Uncharacterised protein [Helicobacter muridarum]
MRYILFIFILILSFAFAKLNQCQVVIDEIILDGTCKGSLKHGKFVGYYKNTIVALEVHYKNDYLHGSFKHFYPDGKLHFYGYYKKSKLHGSFYQYNTKNQVLKANFKNGVLHNWLHIFDENKKTLSLKYYYGKLIRQEFLD